MIQKDSRLYQLVEADVSEFWYDYFLNDFENMIYRLEDYALVILGGLIGGYVSKREINLKLKIKQIIKKVHHTFRMK